MSININKYKKWLNNKIPQDYFEQIEIDFEIYRLDGYDFEPNPELLNDFYIYKLKKEVVKKLDNF